MEHLKAIRDDLKAPGMHFNKLGGLLYFVGGVCLFFYLAVTFIPADKSLLMVPLALVMSWISEHMIMPDKKDLTK